MNHLAQTEESGVARLQRHRTPILIGVGCLIAGAVAVRACAPAPRAETGTVPQVLSGPTTTTTEPPPPIDPLTNLGQLNPTAAALVGPDYDDRRELATRAAQVMSQAAVDQCALVIGATVGGAWEISTTPGPAHPVPVFAGCPATTTTTKGA